MSSVGLNRVLNANLLSRALNPKFNFADFAMFAGARESLVAGSKLLEPFVFSNIHQVREDTELIRLFGYDKFIRVMILERTIEAYLHP